MIDLLDYGFPIEEFPEPQGLIPARVTEVRRALYKAVCPVGEVSATLTGAFLRGAKAPDDFPAVGDFAYLRYNDSGASAIVRLLPRRTKFSRTDFSGHAAGYVKTVREQVVAANFDSVFILSSLNQDFNVNRILRYLTQARGSGAKPVVLLTKADLCESPEAGVAEIQARAGDVPVFPISAHTGTGFEALSPYFLPGRTVVFLGMSGVGKSSLLNALAGEELMKVSAIREADARGHHTTTHRQLFRLSTGALVIDTPGMRELGLWGRGRGHRSGVSGCAGDRRPLPILRLPPRYGTRLRGETCACGRHPVRTAMGGIPGASRGVCVRA